MAFIIPVIFIERLRKGEAGRKRRGQKHEPGKRRKQKNQRSIIKMNSPD